MALVIDIADAVKAELAEGTFSQEFTPERRVLPDFDLAGQGHWRWSDPHRTTLRIHTKQIATE